MSTTDVPSVVPQAEVTASPGLGDKADSSVDKPQTQTPSPRRAERAVAPSPKAIKSPRKGGIKKPTLPKIPEGYLGKQTAFPSKGLPKMPTKSLPKRATEPPTKQRQRAMTATAAAVDPNTQAQEAVPARKRRRTAAHDPAAPPPPPPRRSARIAEIVAAKLKK